MSNANETVAEIVREMVEFGNHCAAFGGAYSPERWDNLCKRLNAANKREVAAKDAEIEKLTAIINAECRKCGECAKFGKDCMAGDIDGAEDHRACEKFVSREDEEIAELRRRLNVAPYRDEDIKEGGES